MTIAEVKTMLESIEGLSGKVVYYAWPESQAPTLPFICYLTPGNTPFGADNKTYYQFNRFVVELYTQLKDISTETLVETALSSNDIYFRKEWQYLPDENCYLTTYDFEV